jgi:hypothetical protein
MLKAGANLCGHVDEQIIWPLQHEEICKIFALWCQQRGVMQSGCGDVIGHKILQKEGPVSTGDLKNAAGLFGLGHGYSFVCAFHISCFDRKARGLMSAPISVVIPTLNSANSLPATLLSLMEGLDAGLICEVVVSDGGSTDASGAYRLGLGRGDCDRCRLARRAIAPRGGGHARRMGDGLACGYDLARGLGRAGKSRYAARPFVFFTGLPCQRFCGPMGGSLGEFAQ